MKIWDSVYIYPDTRGNLAIESYANFKDQSGSGYSMLQITLNYIVNPNKFYLDLIYPN